MREGEILINRDSESHKERGTMSCVPLKGSRSREREREYPLF